MDEKLIESMLEATSSQWKAKFEELQDVPAEELSCSVVNCLEMLQQTAIKLKPNLADKASPKAVDATPMSSMLRDELIHIKSIVKEMLASCENGKTNTCPMMLDLQITRCLCSYTRYLMRLDPCPLLLL